MSRPVPIGIRRALEADDIDLLLAALTPRQRTFCHEYVVDFNGTAAAIRAGYATKWADRQAHLLIKNPGIAKYIDHLTQSKEAKIVSINPDYVIQEILSVIQGDKVRDGDKLRALELLARHLGMFIERTEISGPDGKEIEIKKIKEEADSFVDMIDKTAKRLKLVE